MAKRGQLKDMDAHEQSIRDNAVSYTVIGFQPGRSARSYWTFERLDQALVYAKQVLKDEVRLRSVLIYALDKDDHHALHGTMRRDDMIYKEVVPATY
jgi:hypothetical protein